MRTTLGREFSVPSARRLRRRGETPRAVAGTAPGLAGRTRPRPGSGTSGSVAARAPAGEGAPEAGPPGQSSGGVSSSSAPRRPPAPPSRAESQQSIPGIGPVSAVSLAASMPERGTLGRRVAGAPRRGSLRPQQRPAAERALCPVRVPPAAQCTLYGGPLRDPPGRPAACLPAAAARLREGAQERLVAVPCRLIVLADAVPRESRLWALEPPWREALA